jgi:hypothetical protein
LKGLPVKDPRIVRFEREEFDFITIEDEVRVVGRCQELLKCFYQQLQDRGLTPQASSDLTSRVDYYLRDYLIDFARQNIVLPKSGIIMGYAANWYITNTLDPEMPVLDLHLEAIREFYRFLNRQQFISGIELSVLEDEAGQTEFYRQRIESFLAITGDGYISWKAA